MGFSTSLIKKLVQKIQIFNFTKKCIEGPIIRLFIDNTENEENVQFLKMENQQDLGTFSFQRYISFASLNMIVSLVLTSLS